MSALGEARRERFKTRILSRGISVSVQRNAAAGGSLPAARSLICLIQPKEAPFPSEYMIEGNFNASNKDATTFIFPYDTVLNEGTDTIIVETIGYLVAKVINRRSPDNIIAIEAVSFKRYG